MSDPLSPADRHSAHPFVPVTVPSPSPSFAPGDVLLLMGAAASGKTTVGTALAARLHYCFFDADAFHPAANAAKLSAGVPLSDADRLPWLDAIGAHMAHRGSHGVYACSALKRSYRRRLRQSCAFRLIYLRAASHALLHDRAVNRLRAGSHLLGPTPEFMLSQIHTLEEPDEEEEEEAITIDCERPVHEIVDTIVSQLPTR